MKKQVILRGLLGIPLGIAIGHVITLIISLGWANGYYSPCVPALIETMGSELNAVLLQTILSGVLGASFAAISIIWEIDHWSIAKQSGVYFLIASFVMMPIAYLTNWMKHTFMGFLSYFAIFVLIFLIVWFIQYLLWKKSVQKLNAKVEDRH